MDGTTKRLDLVERSGQITRYSNESKRLRGPGRRQKSGRFASTRLGTNNGRHKRSALRGACGIGRSRVTRFFDPVVASLTALALGVAVVPAGASHEEEEPQQPRCRGHRATIVAQWGDHTTGTPGRDVIVGTRGRDHIDGRGGDDVICGGGSDDVLIGGPGADELVGGKGKDTLDGGPGRDVLRGGSQADDLDGGPGRDLLLGHKGDDTLMPGPGRDRVIGGRGEDTSSYVDSDRGVNVDMSLGTVTGEGRDSLRGVEVVVGSAHSDIMRGSKGPDALLGGPGRDRIFGRSGQDRLQGGEDRDLVHGGPGVDLLTYVFRDFGVTVSLADHKDRLKSIEGLQGSTSADRLKGRSRADIIEGLGGNDTLIGAGGDDTLNGGPGTDTFIGGAGDDTIRGESGDDILDFGANPRAVDVDLARGRAIGNGTDRIYSVEDVIGSDFSDRISGSDDGEEVWGRGGDDIISMGGGNDQVSGGEGSDQIHGGPGIDRLWGGDGDDVLVGGDDFDSIAGGDGNDVIDGGGAADELFGDSGDDWIKGGGGDDVIHPGPGDDRVEGGPGTDAVEFGSAVRANLTTGSATGEGSDVLVGIEDLIGSDFADVLIGDDGPNVIMGEDSWLGSEGDELYGLEGDDQLLVGSGEDQITDGGAGTDLCEGADTQIACELPKPHPSIGGTTRETTEDGPVNTSFDPQDEPHDEGAVASESTAFQVNAAHTGHVAGTGLVPPLQQKWTRSFGGPVSYPIFADGLVFVTEGVTRFDDFDGDGTSRVHALDPETGVEVWKRETGTESAVTFENGRLLWADHDGFVAALDPQTGNFLWQRDLPFDRAAGAAPIADGDDLYLKAGPTSRARGGVYALDASSGAIEWMRETPTSSTGGGPALSEDRVFVAHPAPSIWAWERDSGYAPWLFRGCCTGGGGWTSAYYQGRVYAYRAGGGYGYALDAETGEQVGLLASDTIPAISGSTAVFLEDSAMESWDIYGDGLRWTFDPGTHLQSAPLIVDGYAYVGAAGPGEVYAVDLVTGEEAWSAPLPGNVASAETFFDVTAVGLGAAPGILVVPAQRTLTAFGPPSG